MTAIRVFRWSGTCPGPGWVARGVRQGYGWWNCLWEFVP